MIPLAQSTSGPEVTGLQITDLYECNEFLCRERRGTLGERHMEALQRLAHAFVIKPESVLKQLADTAVELCGADSAGITLQTRTLTGEPALKWVAISGEFEVFSGRLFPFVNTACGTGIERARPQLFRMGQEFYNRLGIEAAPVTDGILIPWRTGTLRGTVWIMAHSRTEAFEANDARVMEMLASFAAMAFRQQRQQRLVLEQASQAAAAAMANELAHSINNPLQSLTNLVFLAAQDESHIDRRELADQMKADLERLGLLVKSLLALPMKRGQSRFGDSSSANAT